ncbi:MULTISPECIES: hypothetical protein [unclassified Streptomyces]|uniref:hypothetical protein n=1 Tax=unclassified Streptomyces TaxID=2593676 RepID=UPI0038264474
MIEERVADGPRLSGPVPVVRPRGMRAHAVASVRQARIYADGRDIVVRDRRLSERRYAVGPSGITRAVLVPPGDVWRTALKRPAELWGVLFFRNAAGHDVLRVPIADWLPEARTVAAMELTPAQCLDRTGLRTLVAQLGIPLEEPPPPAAESIGVTSTRNTTTGPNASDAPNRSDWAATPEFPRWHAWVRGVGGLGWLLAWGILIVTGAQWMLAVVAGALLLVPGADLAVRVSAWWRHRRDLGPGGGFADSVLIAPSPEPGAGATPRFLRTASLRVLPDDVVLTDAAGLERWIGRSGSQGVARLVRLVTADSGRPLGVEMRDGNGDTRALLPWRHWFAGPDGEARWSALRSALSVPVTDQRTHTGAGPWPEGHLYATDAHWMSPLPGKEARKLTSWNDSVIGGGELIVIPVFSAPLVFLLLGDSPLAFLTGTLATLTVLAELVPPAVATLRSRLAYDKPDGTGPRDAQ